MDARANDGHADPNGRPAAPGTRPPTATEPQLRAPDERPASSADGARITLPPPNVGPGVPVKPVKPAAVDGSSGVADDVANHPPASDAEPSGEEAPREESTGFRAAFASMAEPIVSVATPIVDHIVLPVAGAIGNALEAASNVLGVREAITEHLSGRGEEGLPNLYDVHPEAREASPRELGFRFVPIEDIKGTAVAGIAQRGRDFLPLRAFRGDNWEGRWKRILLAYDRLTPLPPVDLIKFDGGYWVLDGHNRVAATIHGKGVGLDAMVVELVPLDGRVSELPSSVLPFLGDAADLRNAATGRTPAQDRVIVPEMPVPSIEPALARAPEIDMERVPSLPEVEVE